MLNPSNKSFLRILFVNSIQMYGGGEIWMLTTLQALRQRGHWVGLICRPGTELAQHGREAGLPTYTITMRGDFDPVTIYRFYRVMQSFRADIILTNMDKELRLVGAATRFCRGMALIPRRGSDYPLKNHPIYRLTYQKWADGVLANSRATKQSLLRNAPWLNPEKIKIVYNGVDPTIFAGQSNKLCQKLGIADGTFVFGFVGQLDERKGLHDLLPAFARVHAAQPQTCLLLAGEGALRREIEIFVQKQHLANAVRLLGFWQDIPALMASVDTLVLPSLWEGFGIVLIEAMAAGKPVIATRASNLPEVVLDGEVGTLVPVHNPEQLAAAMLQFTQNSALVEKMGAAAREWVRSKFTLQHMVTEIEDYFYSVLAHRRDQGIAKNSFTAVRNKEI